MATHSKSFDAPGYTAASDLSAKQFYIVKAASASTCDVPSGATDTPLGILQNKPTSGLAAEIQDLGIAKVLAGGTIAIGDLVGTNASGQAITKSSSGNLVIGRALEAAVSGDIFRVQLAIGSHVP